MTSVSATSSNVTKWLRTRQRNGVGSARLAHSERTQLKETTSKRPPLPSPPLPLGRRTVVWEMGGNRFPVHYPRSMEIYDSPMFRMACQQFDLVADHLQISASE